LLDGSLNETNDLLKVSVGLSLFGLCQFSAKLPKQMWYLALVENSIAPRIYELQAF
jgi:hypothetical protein